MSFLSPSVPRAQPQPKPAQRDEALEAYGKRPDDERARAGRLGSILAAAQETTGGGAPMTLGRVLTGQ